MFNATLTTESIETILRILDKDMRRIEEEALAWEQRYNAGDIEGFERHHARWLDLKAEHIGKLVGLRLAMRYSESITVNGKPCLDAYIMYDDVARKHEVKGL